MRIAYITDTYLPETNGIVTSIHNFTENLAKDGHQILIIAPKYNKKHDHPVENITIKRYPSFSFASNKNTRIAYPYITSIVSDLRKFKPDVIHIQTPMSIGVAGIMAAKILGIPSIQTYHSYIPDFMVYLSPYKIFGFEKATDAIASSRVVKKIIESGAYKGFDKFNEDIRERSEVIKGINKLTRRFRHQGETTFSERFAWDFTRFLYGKSNIVLTPSIVLAKLLTRHRMPVPVYDMSNGIEFHSFAKKKDYHIRNSMIYVGRLGLEKGVDVVVKAFAKAHKTKPELRLDIYGDGPAKDALHRLVEKLGLTESVGFVGFVSRAEIKRSLKRHDFFVTASPMETQGLVILEAMAAGLPVLGVDALAVPELIHDDKNGYLVEPHNYTQMAEAMIKLTESAERNKRFGEQSVEYASVHDISKCVAKLEDVYMSLIESTKERKR